MAPPARRRKRDPATAAPAIDPAERINKLPNEILAQIISFLPARDAVRTCALARAWRDVWRLSTRLLITGGSVREARGFADRLLRCRLDGLEGASLDACKIAFDPPVDDGGDAIFPLGGEDTATVNGWIHRALRCRVTALRVDMGDRQDLETYLQMSKRPLIVSPHLIRLELRGVWFTCGSQLDFSGCPALEHLEISYCNFVDVRRMCSPSVRRPVIESCESVEDPYRFRICVPRLVSLRLEDMDFRTPLLDSMPELVASICQDWLNS